MMLIVRENEQEVDGSIFPKQQPLTITPKQSEMQCHNQELQLQVQLQSKLQQQTAGELVSHVPVSIGSWIRTRQSSSSTLSSLSSHEGSDVEHGYPSSLHSHRTVYESSQQTKSSETEMSWSDTSAQDSKQNAKIREISIPKKRHFKKAIIAAADRCKNDYFSPDGARPARALAPAPAPVIAIARPAKKLRAASIEFESTAFADPLSTITTATGFSSASEAQAPPRFVPLPLPLHQHQRGPQQQQQQQARHRGKDKGTLLLLAQDDDAEHLNSLHVFVRKQIEVFTATTTELTEPAPGRKQPIKLHQVGLRCIHCRNAPPKSRVKRAVCYPSAVGRIYHSISDMKFDHFGHCKELPPDVRRTFEILKAESKLGSNNKDNKDNKDKDNNKKSKSSGGNKRGQSSSSTARYYRESASRMGLVDGPAGTIIYQGLTSSPSPDAPAVPAPALLQPLQPLQSFSANTGTNNSSGALVANTGAMVASSLFPSCEISNLLAASTNGINTNTANTESDLMNLAVAMKSGLLQSLLMSAIVAGANAQKSIDAANNKAVAKSQQQQQPQVQVELGTNSSSNNNHSPEQTVQDLLARAQQANNNSVVSFSHPEAPCATATSAPAPATIRFPLASPEDARILNPLHCFVRKHVELFEADEEDISAPAPGRKTKVVLGQVGIRCVHCYSAKAKKRGVPPHSNSNPNSAERVTAKVKRAVCYPPTIESIYHSVSNMKFDHFAVCPHLPSECRAELAALRTSRNGGRRYSHSHSSGSTTKSNSNVYGSCKRGASGSGTTNTSTNTAHYYRDSAIAKGLVDTDKGIRFGDRNQQQQQQQSPPAVANEGTELKPVPASPVALALPSVAAPQSFPFPTGMSALMMAAASHATSI